MGIINSNKQISVDRIDCNGTLKVTLGLSAAPDIASNPTDILLVLDRSGSMTGSPLAAMKAGANAFIDIIDEATDNSQDGSIGSGSRIGIVSFADTAVEETQLITSVDTLKTAVNSLTAGGLTNHGAAFSTAAQMFDPVSGNAKVIVMFTDGKTTVGLPPSPIAAAARASGIVIYSIGLGTPGSIDVAALNDWATDPDSSHVAITPNEEDLEELFKDLAANISKPGAVNIVIDEVIHPDFVITGVTPPTKGTSTMLNPNTLQWKIPELGVLGNEGASLEFYIKHIANTSGQKFVNQSITYTDDEANMVTFPDPSVTVECDIILHPEPCPLPTELVIDGCQDSVLLDLGDTYLDSLGRILQLDVTVKNVCPAKRTALAVILTEVDAQGTEHPRGTKTITIPAHHYPQCRDILVKGVKFVLPEDLDVSGGSPNSICNERNFKARFISHYIDTDYSCCEASVSV